MARKKISISKFKAECLSILDRLDAEGLEITKHGKVIAKVIPIDQVSASLIGCMKGLIESEDDLFSTEVVWDAES